MQKSQPSHTKQSKASHKVWALPAGRVGHHIFVWQVDLQTLPSLGVAWPLPPLSCVALHVPSWPYPLQTASRRLGVSGGWKNNKRRSSNMSEREKFSITYITHSFSKFCNTRAYILQHRPFPYVFYTCSMYMCMYLAHSNLFLMVHLLGDLLHLWDI